MKYFISDLHIGDRNIMIYEHRPFKSLEEMRETIIHNWNNIVKEDDEVYLLGDIGDVSILKELKGHIIVICGNHDKIEELNSINNIEVNKHPIMVDYMWLSHKPIEYMPPEIPYINIHGHLHRFEYGLIGRKWKDGNRYFNVSVERIDYTPISFDKIIEIMEIA